MIAKSPLLIALAGALAREPTPAPAPEPCRAGSHSDAARAWSLTFLLSRSSRPDLAPTDRPICFGGAESSIDDAQITLAANEGEAAVAARLGHLMVHAKDGLPFRDRDRRDCAVAIVEARRLETAAWAVERALRIDLGAPAIEPDAIDRVIAGYRARCR